MKTLSLYIHIPFCISKCKYCDFLSFSKNDEIIEKYIKALIKEIKLKKDEFSGYYIKTIFIGGGTPTILNSRMLFLLLEAINNNFNIDTNTEFTIESNPGTLDNEKINVLRDMLVNRISMGLQSCDDKMLKKIGRIHTYEQFEDNYYKIRDAGIKNINVDLMFGLPDQTLQDWLFTLKKVTNLNPEHISSYGLIIEKGTPFFDLYKSKKLILPTDEAERNMYYKTIEFLKEKDYNHYEISNFSKNEYECKHNIVYWQLEPYIGLGLGAHSYFNSQRYCNTSDLSKYIKDISEEHVIKNEIQLIDKKASMEEFMFLGLRMIEGISKTNFKNKYGSNVFDIYGSTINQLIGDNLLIDNDDKINLTKKGIDLSNYVFSEFLL